MKKSGGIKQFYRKHIKKIDFNNVVKDKKLPILTLDNRWHELFSDDRKTPEIKGLEGRLNDLLKKQGKLVNEVKDMKLLKKKLLGDIVSQMDTGNASQSSAREMQQDKNREYILEINEKIDLKMDELAEIPYQIKEVNEKLLIKSMAVCYDNLKNNHDQLKQLDDWIAKTREELKEGIVLKQDMEARNSLIYTYMHDLLGAELMEILDDEHEDLDF